jgi:hypothetical protein
MKKYGLKTLFGVDMQEEGVKGAFELHPYGWNKDH